MTITIEDLVANTFTVINETFGCGNWYVESEKVVNDYGGGEITFDLTLTENVILKTHDDSITLDKGGTLATISRDDFKVITIL